MRYIDEFLELKCAGDVINSVYPILTPSKEISEAMSIFKKLRKLLYNSPSNEFTVFDLCCGNCLISSLLAHTFKFKAVYGIDMAERKRKGFSLINGFKYLQKDIKKDRDEIIDLIKKSEPAIIVSSHPCCDLSTQIVKIFNESKAKHLVIIPCCEGKVDFKFPNMIREKLSSYEMWCLYISILLPNSDLKIDNYNISPKNIVVTATLKE